MRRIDEIAVAIGAIVRVMPDVESFTIKNTFSSTIEMELKVIGQESPIEIEIVDRNFQEVGSSLNL